jgi:ribonuclease BN (tRNA processing enzyme)
VEFFRDADLLIFDAQYTLLDAIDTKENWGHSSNLTAVELAVQAGVKRLCLFHTEHSYSDEVIDQFCRDTRKYLKIHAEGRTASHGDHGGLRRP